MNCTEYLAVLHAYFQGLASEAERRGVEEHAAACSACGALMARARELSCREFTAFLDAYLENELEPEQRRLFERHLEICPDCHNYLQSYRATMHSSVMALRGELPAQPVPEDLILAVLKAVKPKPAE